MSAASDRLAQLRAQQTPATSPAKARLDELRLAQQPDKEATLGEQAFGALETAGAIGSAAIAEPISGLAGIAAGLDPFAPEGEGERIAEATRESLTFEPKTAEGIKQIQAVAKTLQPIAEILERADKASGD